MELWVQEGFTSLPKDYAWERFGTEDRRVSWDGFISYDGVLYGLPADPPVAGSVVLVRKRERELRIFHQGSLIATVQKRPRSQEIVIHPEQFRDVPPLPYLRHSEKPLGHQVQAPTVVIRSLCEYDQIFGVEVRQ